MKSTRAVIEGQQWAMQDGMNVHTGTEGWYRRRRGVARRGPLGRGRWLVAPALFSEIGHGGQVAFRLLALMEDDALTDYGCHPPSDAQQALFSWRGGHAG